MKTLSPVLLEYKPLWVNLAYKYSRKSEAESTVKSPNADFKEGTATIKSGRHKFPTGFFFFLFNSINIGTFLPC